MKRLLLASLLLLATSSAACSTDGLLFVADERVTITAPEDRSEVELPVTITWDVDGFEIQSPGGSVAKDAGHFGVYVNRSPVGPGKKVTEARDVIITTDTQLTLEEVFGNQEFHSVTIVLVDGAGNRIGESAFAVTFKLADPDEVDS